MLHCVCLCIFMVTILSWPRGYSRGWPLRGIWPLLSAFLSTLPYVCDLLFSLSLNSFLKKETLQKSQVNNFQNAFMKPILLPFVALSDIKHSKSSNQRIRRIDFEQNPWRLSMTQTYWLIWPSWIECLDTINEANLTNLDRVFVDFLGRTFFWKSKFNARFPDVWLRKGTQRGLS